MDKKQAIWNNLIGYTMNCGKIMNIPFKLHWSIIPFFLFIPIFTLTNHYSVKDTIILVSLLALVLLCVLFHELGHAAAAKSYGVKTHDIVLSLIGGVARLEKIPEEPKQEFRIAFAGPLVNLIIFLFLALILLVIFQFGLIDIYPTFKNITDPEIFLYRYDPSLFVVFLYVLAFANLALFLFNLLPVFPMDGGRILRAFLSSKIGRLKATKIAAFIGKVLSVVLILYGLIKFDPILSIIGFFVFMMADREYRQEVQNNKYKNILAESIMHSRFSTIKMFTPMSEILENYFNTDIDNYIVYDNQKKISGLIHRSILTSIMREKDKDSMASLFLTNRYAIVNVKDNFHTVYNELVSKDMPLALVMDFGELKGVIDQDMVRNKM